MEQQQEARRATAEAQNSTLQRLPRPGSQPDVVLQIVRAAYRDGMRDITRREIGELWEEMDRAKGRTSSRREASTVARIVFDLVKRKALKQLGDERNRVCGVTGEVVSVVALMVTPS